MAPATNPARLTLDVVGGILFALFVSMVLIRISWSMPLGEGWSANIGWETVWCCAAMAAATLLPSAVDYEITTRSTVLGLLLDWPEIALSLFTFGQVTAAVGAPYGVMGPLGLALAVGAAEEFIFRVALLGWLAGKLDTAAAVLISAVVFGLAHLQEFSVVGLMDVTPQFAGGVVLGAVYLRTRNPLPCILLHAMWDFPYFLGWGLVSGGSTAGGMLPMSEVVKYSLLAVYGLYLVRTGVPAAGRQRPVRASL